MKTKPAKPAPRQATFVSEGTTADILRPAVFLKLIERAQAIEHDLQAGRPVTPEQADSLRRDWSLLQEAKQARMSDPTLVQKLHLFAAVDAWFRAASAAIELAGGDCRSLHNTDAEVVSALARLQTTSRLRPPAAPPVDQTPPPRPGDDLDRDQHRQLRCLLAGLLKLKALDRGSRRTIAQAVKTQVGVAPNGDDFKRASTTARDRGLTDSMGGRSGGLWLTPAGRTRAQAWADQKR